MQKNYPDESVNINKVELLSPAGDFDCFNAALTAGADAVYLSGEKYGARAYAKNFTSGEIIKAIETAHLYDSKVYLTVNTLLKNDELSELYDYLYPFYIAGLDSVIVQDMGVISFINEHFPELNIHASTQLAITSTEGIKLLKEIGVKRTVLARELSLNEIKTIHENDDMELECFIHGALCYSYSGKCLFSSLVGGRSGNRGRCAGPCRQPYNDKYLLSTKDICCLEILPELISSGITSFKIEGRMKSPGYVYGVTSIYRKYIDLFYSYDGDVKNDIFAGKEFNKDSSTLESLYTRGGNSSGYYFMRNGKEMISLDDASYIRDTDETDSAVMPPFDKLKISGKIKITTGEAVNLTLKYNNYKIEACGCTAEKAGNRPIDIDTVKRQLLKTGDTVFEFADLGYDISDDAFIRIGDLNGLRRDALLQLKDEILKDTRRQALNQDSGTDFIAARILSKSKTPHECIFSADICTIPQFGAAVSNEKVKRIYVPYALAEGQEDLIDLAKRSGKEVYIKFQSVIRNSFLQKNSDEILRIINIADGVLADNNEIIYFLKENGYDKPVTADIHLYVLNSGAARMYASLGISRFTVPVELNRHELYERGITNEELIVYGYLPMMVSAQCVGNTLNGCDSNDKHIKLKDRKNAVFTCVNDCGTCTNIIYNSVPLSLHDEDELIDTIKPESLKLLFTTEDEMLTGKILNFFTNGCYNNEEMPYKAFTKGHINRGVL